MSLHFPKKWGYISEGLSLPAAGRPLGGTEFWCKGTPSEQVFTFAYAPVATTLNRVKNGKGH